MADRAHLQRLAREFSQQHRPLEAGWISFRLACDLEDAPDQQLEDMRNSFFAGARYLLTAIVELEMSDNEADFGRGMEMYERELREFIRDFSSRNIPTVGSA
jgi:hypothetical protein